MAVEFDVIPFEDLKGKWKKLGAGSFGNVYKAKYLGIDVAIKEVLPSDEYDVAKYFEREWRLMREARHPNVVLYIALSRAPKPDNRIFIISEFIENGNLRQFIHDKTKYLPWRLRLSFATDIVRAMAYLHARQCVHRDLKPENLLITANGRIKVTDFGFARVVADTADERRRLTYCGTDAYMSPEILMGDPFGLETDVYSLGMIFCELASRQLAGDETFKRVAPFYELMEEEVRARADRHAPPKFIDLVLACCSTQSFRRPSMQDILVTLGEIEAELIAKEDQSSQKAHVGSIKLLSIPSHGLLPLIGAAHRKNGPSTKTARPGMNRRIPSFGAGVHVGSRPKDPSDSSPHPDAEVVTSKVAQLPDSTVSSDAEDVNLMEHPDENEEDAALEAVLVSNGVDLSPPISKHGSVNVSPVVQVDEGHKRGESMSWRMSGWMKTYASENGLAPQPSHLANLDENVSSSGSSLHSSTESIIARAPLLNHMLQDGGSVKDENDPMANSSVLTVRQNAPASISASEADSDPAHSEEIGAKVTHHTRQPNAPPSTTRSVARSENGTPYFTPATQTAIHMPLNTEAAAGDTEPEVLATPSRSSQALPRASTGLSDEDRQNDEGGKTFAIAPRVHRFSLIKSGAIGWSNAFEFFFGNALGIGAKCHLCAKRLGWKPCLECDDCGLTVHLRCGEDAPLDCEAREAHMVSQPSRILLRTASPKAEPSPRGKTGRV